MLRCQCPCVCPSVRLSVTEVHIANLGFKFRSSRAMLASARLSCYDLLRHKAAKMAQIHAMSLKVKQFRSSGEQVVFFDKRRKMKVLRACLLPC